jgi:hypothetical protein
VPVLFLEPALTPNGDPFKLLLLEKQMIERGEVVANVCLDAMLGQFGVKAVQLLHFSE